MGKGIILTVILAVMLFSVFFLPFSVALALSIEDIYEGRANQGDLFSDSVIFEGSRSADSVSVKLQNPVGFDSLKELVVAILDVIVQVAVPIAALFLIYSGYLFVSARGNEEDLKKAKSIFLWTLVGIAVLLGAKVLTGLIEGTIEQIKG